MDTKIKDFIGIKARYEDAGQMIFGENAKGELQLIADVRGWGAIQNLFKNPDGTIKEEAAMNFQDSVGAFIAEAITEKLVRDA